MALLKSYNRLYVNILRSGLSTLNVVIWRIVLGQKNVRNEMSCFTFDPTETVSVKIVLQGNTGRPIFKMKEISANVGASSHLAHFRTFRFVLMELRLARMFLSMEEHYCNTIFIGDKAPQAASKAP